MVGEIILADTAAKYAKRYEASHRKSWTITLGTDLEQAYQRTELLEDFAKFVLASKILAGAH
jgi:ribulose-5-phosphate 4-epimerase/fuculose-1-phosphate aldolase